MQRAKEGNGEMDGLIKKRRGENTKKKKKII